MERLFSVASTSGAQASSGMKSPETSSTRISTWEIWLIFKSKGKPIQKFLQPYIQTWGFMFQKSGYFSNLMGLIFLIASTTKRSQSCWLCQTKFSAWNLVRLRGTTNLPRWAKNPKSRRWWKLSARNPSRSQERLQWAWLRRSFSQR